jgi:hypothetical protein
VLQLLSLPPLRCSAKATAAAPLTPPLPPPRCPVREGDVIGGGVGCSVKERHEREELGFVGGCGHDVDVVLRTYDVNFCDVGFSDSS